MDDFPVPACPNRTRLRSESGLFTQLTMKSKKAVRVPGRQPFSGIKREPVPYGISLIFASSSVTIVRFITLKSSVLRTSVRNLARYPLQLGSHPVKLTRNPANISRNYSHIVQNLERSYLCSDGDLIQESLSKFDESGAEVPYLFVDLAAEVD